MKKLTKTDIDFIQTVKATKNGRKPSIVFEIKNLTNVEKFLSDSKGTRIWDNTGEPKTARLEYQIDRSKMELTISRAVTSKTFASSANETLAAGVLRLIFDAPRAVQADICGGLTGNVALPTLPEAGESLMQEIENELYEPAASSRLSM